jgi:DNA-binding beta-propeller fold protein YncE
MLVRVLTAAALITASAAHAQAPKDRPERMEEANEPAPDRPVPRPGEIGPRRLPGIQPDGGILLPNQWSLRPAGNQLEVGDFPVNIALHPTQPYAAILHAGHGPHEIVIVQTQTRKLISRVTLPQTFYGICFDHSGTHVYASGGENELVFAYDFGEGLLSAPRRLQIVPPEKEFVVTGLSTSPDDRTLYACGSFGDQLALVSLDEKESGEPRFVDLPKDSYPYAALPTPDGRRVLVSLWGGRAVAVVDTATLKVETTWPTPPHPTEMALSPDGGTLYVACANSNQVAAIDTAAATERRTREIIFTSLYPTAPSGSTPNSLALSPDGSILLVANADNHNIAVINVSAPGQARSMGFIPTGWYPTSVRFRDGENVLYTSGKGLSPKSNRHGPNPEQRRPGGIREYIADLFEGTVGFVRPFKPETLARYTADAFAAAPLKPDAGVTGKPAEPDNPIPVKVGDPSPIKHCVYIVKENRTYDQVLGDMPEGNGDASLCLFPEKVTPNHHALAREFVLLDNFYVDGEVSADGHEWSMGAYATDFVEKAWPLTYRTREKHPKIAHPAEGHYEIAVPSAGYLWDQAKKTGISYFSFGEWVHNGKTPSDPGTAASPALEGHFDPMFRSFDTSYPDIKRAERFIHELKRFEIEGELPALTIVRLPNDHTAGTGVGAWTPTAMVAENDQALGMVVEALSKSKFWSSTAIFVVEDDAQNGSDHVDAHRTVALVISPYCKRHAVDSSMYSTTSMLRTMELILGLPPMSQFDAAALPMYASFTPKPDLAPYTVRPAQVDIYAKNTKTAWGADLSETFDLTREDAADDLLLNEVVWRSVKGPDSPMPPPVRAAFLFSHQGASGDGDDDDDE